MYSCVFIFWPFFMTEAFGCRIYPQCRNYPNLYGIYDFGFFVIRGIISSDESLFHLCIESVFPLLDKRRAKRCCESWSQNWIIFSGIECIFNRMSTSCLTYSFQLSQYIHCDKSGIHKRTRSTNFQNTEMLTNHFYQK